MLLVASCDNASVPLQAYLNGVESPIFDQFFTVRTFIAKVFGAALAVASSLVMGKEGPMLHAGAHLVHSTARRRSHIRPNVYTWS